MPQCQCAAFRVRCEETTGWRLSWKTPNGPNLNLFVPGLQAGHEGQALVVARLDQPQPLSDFTTSLYVSHCDRIIGLVLRFWPRRQKFSGRFYKITRDLESWSHIADFNLATTARLGCQETSIPFNLNRLRLRDSISC